MAVVAEEEQLPSHRLRRRVQHQGVGRRAVGAGAETCRNAFVLSAQVWRRRGAAVAHSRIARRAQFGFGGRARIHSYVIFSCFVYR